MENRICTCCRQPKGAFECGPCKAALCKKCAQFVREGSFSFLEKVPAEVLHKTFCGPCYDTLVVPVLREYELTMRRAKGIHVYFKSQGEETRLIRRSEKSIKVDGFKDREETLLRLAFFAAHSGFDTLVDVQLDSKKIRNEAYQTTRWSGTGVPVRRRV